MSRLADDTKIAKGTKRAGEEVRAIVQYGYDLLTQVRRHKDAKKVYSDCKDNDRPEHDSDYKGHECNVLLREEGATHCTLLP